MSRKHIAIACLPGRGHLYPAIAIGRQLQRRGHRVSLFGSLISQNLIKTSGLELLAFRGRHLTAGFRLREAEARSPGLSTLDVMSRHVIVVLTEAMDLLQGASVDGLLVDQADLASGSVADARGIPYLSLSFFPPVFFSDEVPPFVRPWPPAKDVNDLQRNGRANAALARVLKPLQEVVNRRRKEWSLEALAGLNDFFSAKGIIAQCPMGFDFPRREVPKNLFHMGPFIEETFVPFSDFPWDRLNGRPLAYCSMGTVRNTNWQSFHMMASALYSCGYQVVLSLGGMHLDPRDFEDLPGRPIVVHFAPQRSLLALASIVIFHGGMNTAIEAAINGVPMIALPVTDDQPGVAARIRWSGVGDFIPHRAASLDPLTDLVRKVTDQSSYRDAATTLATSIRRGPSLDSTCSFMINKLFPEKR